MGYKLIISKEANKHLDDIINYIAVGLSNPQAAKALIDEIEIAYRKLEKYPEVYAVCADKYLASKGYRKLLLGKHNYVILYQVMGHEVHINGIFHMRENYASRL